MKYLAALASTATSPFSESPIALAFWIIMVICSVAIIVLLLIYLMKNGKNNKK